MIGNHFKVNISGMTSKCFEVMMGKTGNRKEISKGVNAGKEKACVFLLVIISVVLSATPGVAVVSLSAAEVQQIKPEELKRLIETNDSSILVVDTQPKEAYDLGHIREAINFPWAMDIKSPGDLPKDKTLVLYCDCAHAEDSIIVFEQPMNNSGFCADEDDSTDVAKQLMSKFGYGNIKVLEGGWSRWQQLGYPVDKR
jgi:rhodanese-related sulfurtransferase